MQYSEVHMYIQYVVICNIHVCTVANRLFFNSCLWVGTMLIHFNDNYNDYNNCFIIIIIIIIIIQHSTARGKPSPNNVRRSHDDGQELFSPDASSVLYSSQCHPTFL